MITPSKSSEIYFFQQDEQVYEAGNNSFYNRGNYARPWPRYHPIQAFVKLPDATYTPNGWLTNCDGVALANVSSVHQGNGLYLITCPTAPLEMKERAYIQVVNKIGANNVIVDLFNVTPIPGDSTGVNSAYWRGVQLIIPQSTQLVKVIIDAVITGTLQYNILYSIYRVNPRNLTDITPLITNIGNAAYTGMSGSVMMEFNIDLTGSKLWGAGDILMVLFRTEETDAFIYATSPLRQANPTSTNSNAWDVIMFPTGEIRYDRGRRPDGITVTGIDCIYSELIEPTVDGMYPVTYKNVKAYDNVPANFALTTQVRGNMWQRQSPQEFETIEVSPGEFVRIRSEIHRTITLETDFMPGYGHEQLQNIFGRDGLIINNVEYVQRNPYEYTYSNRHYGLAKGSIELTERKSILRNTI